MVAGLLLLVGGLVIWYVEFFRETLLTVLLLALLGFIFPVVGIVFLFHGRTRHSLIPLPLSPSGAPSPVCLGCGTMFPSPAPKFCPSCGKAVPEI